MKMSQYVTIAVNRNLSNCKKARKKHFGASTGFEPVAPFHSVFHSFHGLMNSINWPASGIWVFIAQAGRALQR